MGKIFILERQKFSLTFGIMLGKQKRIILFAKVTILIKNTKKCSKKENYLYFLSPRNYNGEYTVTESVCFCVSLM